MNAKTLLALLLLASPGTAQWLWTGGFSQNYHTASNWAPASVPPATATVNVPAGTPNAVVISSSGIQLAGLTVQSGASVTVLFGRDLQIDGELTVQGTLDLVEADSVATVVSDLTVTGQLPGAGSLRLSGGGTVTAPANPLPHVELAGGSFVFKSCTLASYLQTAGELVIGDDALVNVLGDATWTAGSVRWENTSAGSEILDVDGDVLLSGTLAGTTDANSVFRCGGDWDGSASFAMANGRVELDGGGAADVSPTALAFGFPDLVIVSGTKTLQHGGTVNGSLTVEGGATLDTAQQSLLLHGDLTMNGSGAVITGSLPIQLQDSTVLDTGANVAPALTGSGVTLRARNSVVASVSLTGGLVEIADDATLHVLGDFTLGGSGINPGVLSFDDTSAGPETLDVDGKVDLLGAVTAGATNLNSVIRCAGDWKNCTTFLMAGGWIELDGGSSQISVPPGLAGTLNLRVAGGVKSLNSDLRIHGEVVVEAGATLDLAGREIEIEGDWTSNGAGAVVQDTSSTGAVVFIGDSVARTGANPLPPVRVEQQGIAGFKTSLLERVDVVAGRFQTLDDAVVQVQGDLVVQSGGTLDWIDTSAGVQTLDVDGDVVLQPGALAGVADGLAVFAAAGDWTSHASFAMADGVVELDGGAALIQGTGTTFPDLLLESGERTLAADATVTGDLSSTAGTTAGAGFLVVVGAGVEVQLPASRVERLRVAAGSAEILNSEVGDFELTGGTATIKNAHTLHVQGDALLSGGTLAFAPTGSSQDALDVDGALTASGTALGSTHTSSRIRCAGDWSSEPGFVFADGRVELDGAGTAAIGGPGPVFRDVRILSGARVLTADTVLQENAELSAGASLDLNGRDLEVQGALDCKAAGASVTGAGPVRFTGSGEVATGANPFPPILVDGGSPTFRTSVIASGAMTAGALQIRDDALVRFEGDLTLFAGTLNFAAASAGTEVLDVDGDFTAAAAVTVGQSDANSRLRCAGDWSSESGFVVQDGIVQLDGGDATLSGASPTFDHLQLDSGVVTVASETIVTGSLVSEGGTTAGPAFLVMTGPDALVDSSANALARLRVAAGVCLIRNSTVGALELTGGELRIRDDHTLTVTGSATLGAGVLSFADTSAGAETLDVGGDFQTLAATVGDSNGNSRILCAGDWSSNSFFQLDPAAVVELDGVGTTLLSGSEPSHDPVFPELVLKNGTREVAEDVSLAATTVAVLAGAALDVADHQLTVAAAPLDVDGTLAVGPGGSLLLGTSAATTVSSTGTLQLLGDPGAPASIGGAAGGGYALAVDGLVAARNFRFEDMGPAGVQLGANAALAPAPDDLRGGTFDRAAPGGVLLDLQLPGAHAFEFVNFEDTTQTAAFNVRRLTGSTVSFVNWGGAFAGAAFEDDPGDRVDWLPPEVTSLDSFTATPGPELASLAWTSLKEVGIESYLLESAPAPSGPFALLAELAPQGPSAYGFLDQPLAEDVPVHYRLSERLLHGPVNVLATALAVPYDADVPAVYRDVGGAGPFATIQAAIDSASAPLTVVRVAPGTYAPFSIDAPPGNVHVIGDGTGPVIVDGAPIVVANTAFGQTVQLADLVVNGDAAGPAVAVAGALGLIVLDRLEVHGGPGQPGLSVAASPAVSLQRSDVDGSPGLAVAAGSAVYAGRGTLDAADLTGGSLLKTCQTTPAVTLDGTSQHVPFAGVLPDLGAPPFQSLNVPFDLAIETEPGALWQLGISTGAFPLDLGDPAFWQMLLMLDIANHVVLATGFSDGATGLDSHTLTIPPDGVLLGLAAPLQLWSIEIAPQLSVRFSNLLTVFTLP